MSGRIIALVGPSGVGKNFAKQAIKKELPEISELKVYTTRTRRLSDGVDREAGIPVDIFLKMRQEGKIIGAHQPFGEKSDWYGFSREQIDEMLTNNNLVLTEIHPDNIPLFKRLYGDKIFTIALIAETEYLEHNLESRNSEKETDRATRLNSAINEIKIIQKMLEEKLIDRMIEVNWDNRDNLSELVIDEVSREIKLPVSQENKLKFK